MPMPVRLSFVAVLLTLGAASPAWATATLDCSGSNGPFKLEISAAIGSTGPGPIANAGGRVEMKTGRIPADLATVTLERDDLVHHWLEGDQLSLHFYRERADKEPFGFVEAVLTTRRVSKTDGDYTGRFKLKASYLKKTGDTTPIEFAVTGGVKCVLG